MTDKQLLSSARIISNDIAGSNSTGFKRSLMYGSLSENDPISQWIYYLSKQFPHEFIVSVASF